MFCPILVMITLTRKLKKESDSSNSTSADVSKRISVRDKLLVKEYDSETVERYFPAFYRKEGKHNSPFSKAFTCMYVAKYMKCNLEVQEMEQTIPSTCAVKFADPHQLHDFYLIITPDEGYWMGGYFKFHINVTEEYNMAPPVAKCLTKLWHPNISEDGDICLSLLRQNSIDGMGWAPTRKLKDIVWGLNSLFTDLLNFDDPLNIEAAELYQKDKEAFRNKVREYVNQYAKKDDLLR